MSSTATATSSARTVGNVAKTSKQVELTNKLIAELREFDNAAADATRQSLINTWKANLATGAFLYKVNETLMAKLREHRAAARKQAEVRTALPHIPAGRYAVENAEGVLRFYRVRESGGRYTVSVMASDEEHRLGYRELRATLERIEAAGPLQAAIAYGQHIGACGVCGRTLTHPDSIAAGIGPICAKKF